tara:strand:- start:80 stop:358 length:279 start_codon:yes stop_codon:yes gene_type:complete
MLLQRLPHADTGGNRNVHMYTHALSVQNKQTKYSISCEDLPTNEKTIGIWLYTSSIPQASIKELQQVLLNWAKQYPIKFQIYASKDDFATNK